MVKRKPSRFLSELPGFEDTDLRKHIFCETCGVRITNKNYGVVSQDWGNGGFQKSRAYCDEHFLDSITKELAKND